MGDDDHSFADELQPAPRDGRGHYDRSGGKGVRLAWIPYVQRHMDAISKGDLSVCSRLCAKNCPQGGKCLENVGLLRVLKVCAAESFGEAALEQEWTKITSNYDAVCVLAQGYGDVSSARCEQRSGRAERQAEDSSHGVVGRRRWTWRRSLVTGARRRGRQRRSQDMGTKLVRNLQVSYQSYSRRTRSFVHVAHDRRDLSVLSLSIDPV